jgi:phosphatidylinositol 3-kinase
MVVDHKDKSSSLDPIDNRKIYRWVEDDAVTRCYLCNSEFTVYYRKHHCYMCLRIFCYKCANKKIVIPHYLKNTYNLKKKDTFFKHINTDYLSNSPHARSLIHQWKGKHDSNEQRVCNSCYNKISDFNKLEKDIKVFNILKLDVYALRQLKLVSKRWHRIANYNLSKFREIQYYLPTHKYTDEDRDLLWVNKDYIIGHNLWIVQLLKSIDGDEEKLLHVYKLINKSVKKDIIKFKENKVKVEKSNSIDIQTDYKFNASYHIDEEICKMDEIDHMERNSNCWDMMCSRHCCFYLRGEDCLCLLNHTVQSLKTRYLAIKYLNHTPICELRCYLPLLTHYMRYEGLEHPFIGNFIISKCIGPDLDVYFINDVYWELKINMESTAFLNIYKHFLDRFCKEIPQDLLEVIFKGQYLTNVLENLPKNISEDEIVSYIDNHITNISHITLPTEPFLDYTGIDVGNIRVNNSATRPVILPFIYECDNVVDIAQILYKSEDVRKDYIIIKIIKLMDMILKQEEGLDLNIITYDVKPTTSNSGIIQIIPNCSTMYYIKEKQKLTILNWIIEHNPNITVKELRERFLQSCSAYCVITYLLGIGDRHLNNIMVTKNGVLFHIDYSFILGFDPKALTSPKIRIDPDMIDALGGVNSQYYVQFNKLCNKIFNCLRRHVNLFINLLSLLVEVDPPIKNKVNFTREILMDEIMKRFIPGENYKDAEVQLTTQIESSSTTTYGQYLNDLLHYHNHEQTLSKTVVNTKNIISNISNWFI